jgi:hypothetical protein
MFGEKMSYSTKTNPMLVVSTVCAALLAAACSNEPQDPSDWIAVRDTVGDTIVVRTVSGSTMGPLSYVEELSIGQLDGPPEYAFGEPGCVLADGHGGVFVFDMQVPALMQYDSTGTYVRTIGGEGEGPGEYKHGCAGIARHPGGGVVIFDAGNSRINAYSFDGEPLNSIRMATQPLRTVDVDVDAAGRIYETGRVAAGNPPERTLAVVTHEAEGAVVDTVLVPDLPGERHVGSFAWLPNQSADFSPTLGLVISDPMDYRIYVGHETESVLCIEREAEPVGPFAEEMDNLRRYVSHYGGNLGRELRNAFDQLPDRKPFIHNVRLMDDGRIWVQVHAPAEHVPSDQPQREDAEPRIEWREPNYYDVFEPDGVYLGRLELPRTESIADASGDELWILRRGELDEAYVVRGRLVGR